MITYKQDVIKLNSARGGGPIRGQLSPNFFIDLIKLKITFQFPLNIFRQFLQNWIGHIFNVHEISTKPVFLRFSFLIIEQERTKKVGTSK